MSPPSFSVLRTWGSTVLGTGPDFDLMAQIVPEPPYVLVVESDPTLREQMGDAFYRGGFVPLLAECGTDALRYMAGAGVPVLVILDLDCHGLEPRELLAYFKADVRWALVPVVVTGSSGGETALLHVDGLLPKPFDERQLLAAAQKAIAPRR